MEVYTKGIDIARRSPELSLMPALIPGCQMETYYKIADATWLNFQNEIKSFVENYDGTANVLPKKVVRVDNEKIKDLLELPYLIQSIPCD